MLLTLFANQAVSWIGGKHEADMNTSLPSPVRIAFRNAVRDGAENLFSAQSNEEFDLALSPFWSRSVDPSITPENVTGFGAILNVDLDYFTWEISETPEVRWQKYAEDVLQERFSIDNPVSSLQASLTLSYRNWRLEASGEWDMSLSSSTSASFRLNSYNIFLGYKVTF